MLVSVNLLHYYNVFCVFFVPMNVERSQTSFEIVTEMQFIKDIEARTAKCKLVLRYVELVPKYGSRCKGSCRGIANMGAADASRRFAH